MVQKQYTVTITSTSEQRCKEVMEALMKLKKNASDDDLIFFANKLEQKPGLLQTAKKFL